MVVDLLQLATMFGILLALVAVRQVLAELVALIHSIDDGAEAKLDSLIAETVGEHGKDTDNG